MPTMGMPTKKMPKVSSNQSKEQGKPHALQRPDYCVSTLMERGKWGRGTSSPAMMWSEVTAQRMAVDVRGCKLRSIYRYPKERNNAFSRGEVTLGWDFSTTKDTKYMAQKKKKAVRPFKVSYDLPNYVGPQQRVEALISDKKEAAEQQKEAHRKLVETYGPEGAAEMAYIDELKARRGEAEVPRHRMWKVSRAEKQAVLDLPDYSS